MTLVVAVNIEWWASKNIMKHAIEVHGLIRNKDANYIGVIQPIAVQGSVRKNLMAEYLKRPQLL